MMPGYPYTIVASLTLTTSAAIAGTGDVVDVFILAGQSNAVGAGHVTNLDEYLVEFATPNPDVRYCYWINGQNITDEWQILGPRGGFSFGPEMMLGNALHAAEPDRDIAIMKFGWGGTSLVCDWAPYECATGPGLELYDQLKDWMTLWRERIEAEGKICRFAGMAWVQGECESASPWQSPLYAGALTSFINGIREHSGNLEMPVAVSMVNPRASQYLYVDVVHSGMRSVANSDAKVGTTTCRDIQLKSDQVHFSANGMIALGGRLADTLLALDPLGSTTSNCLGDFNGDETVGSADLLEFLENWGPCH